MVPGELKITLCFVLVILAVSFGVVRLAEATCYEQSKSFDGVEFSLVGGCMVKHKGMWLPLDNIRGFD